MCRIFLISFVLSSNQGLTRKPVTEYEACSWGAAPGNAIVVSSAMEVKERLAIQVYMERAAERYAKKVQFVEPTNSVDQNRPIGNKELLNRVITTTFIFALLN